MQEGMEGFFARLSRGQLQPAEIAARLQREMEDRRIIGVSHVYAPNRYDVFVSPSDFRALEPFLEVVQHELTEFVREAAEEKQLVLPGEVQVSLTLAENVRRGGCEVWSQADEVSGRREPEPTTQQAWLEVLSGPLKGETIPITRPTTRIGRGGENDIALTEAAASRRHAEITMDPGRGFHLRDLGSTNGTLVNNKPVMESDLFNGDTIAVGASLFRLKVTRRV